MRGPVDAGAVMVQASESVHPWPTKRRGAWGRPASGTLLGRHRRIIQRSRTSRQPIKFSPTDTTVTLSGLRGEAEFVFRFSLRASVPENKLRPSSIFQSGGRSDSRTKAAPSRAGHCQSIAVRITADLGGKRMTCGNPVSVHHSAGGFFDDRFAGDRGRTIPSPTVRPGSWKPSTGRVPRCGGNIIRRRYRAHGQIAADAIILDMGVAEQRQICWTSGNRCHARSSDRDRRR